MSAVTDVLDRLRGALGTGEHPANSNGNFIVDWYNAEVDRIGNGPWCQMTVTWAFWTGLPKRIVQGRAYTVWAAQDFALRQYRGSSWTYGTAGIRAGDVVYYDWGARKGDTSLVDHVGVVEKVLGDGTFYTLEGNVGDRLVRMRRDGTYVVGYGRPDWGRVAGSPGSSASSGSDGGHRRRAPGPHLAFPLPTEHHYLGLSDGTSDAVTGFGSRTFRGHGERYWIIQFGRQLRRRGWHVGIGRTWLSGFGNNGFFGPEYEALVMRFQEAQGLRQDGRIGPKTWRAAFGKPLARAG